MLTRSRLFWIFVQFKCVQNINAFLISTHRDFGVSQDNLFEAPDLHDVSDFGKVQLPLVMTYVLFVHGIPDSSDISWILLLYMPCVCVFVGQDIVPSFGSCVQILWIRPVQTDRDRRSREQQSTSVTCRCKQVCTNSDSSEAAECLDMPCVVNRAIH